MKNTKLDGNLYLDVPYQNSSISQEILSKAESLGIKIREVEDLSKEELEKIRGKSCEWCIYYFGNY